VVGFFFGVSFMNENVRQVLLLALGVLVLVTSIFSADTIGDKAYQYQSLNSLRTITRMFRPMHQVLRTLQHERNLSSKFLATKSETEKTPLKPAYQKTDLALRALVDEIENVDDDLLAIPDANIPSKLKALDIERILTLKAEQTFFRQYNFYNRLVGEFIEYQEKMFTYANGKDYVAVTKSLLETEKLYDSLGQEKAISVYYLSNPNIKLGEFPLIIQEVSSQTELEENLRNSQDKLTATQIKKIFSSKQYSRLMEVRARFASLNSNATGAALTSEEYDVRITEFLGMLEELSVSTHARLDATADQGISEIRSQAIMATICFIILALALSGLILFRKRVTSRLETGQSS